MIVNGMDSSELHDEFRYIHHFLMGHAFLAKQRDGEALAQFTAALALRPDSAEACYALSLAQDDLEQTRLPPPDSLVPDSFAQAYLRRGFALEQRGEKAEAEKVFARAIALNPATPGTLVHFAYLLAVQGRLEDAIAAFRQALIRQPDGTDAALGLTNMLLHRLDFAAAATVLEGVLGRDGNDAAALMLRAVSWLAQGDLAAAEQDLRHIIDLPDPSAQAYSLLGLLLQKRGEMDDAEILHRRALALDAGDGQAIRYFAFWLLLAGRPQEADTAMSIGMSKTWVGSQSWPHLCHAEFLFLQSLESEARLALERARTTTPWASPLQEKLHRSLFRQP